jgi:hypothetical protein
MQVYSWINGERVLTDMPKTFDPVLAICLQVLNDRFCTHSKTLLCAGCSQTILEAAERANHSHIERSNDFYYRLAHISTVRLSQLHGRKVRSVLRGLRRHDYNLLYCLVAVPALLEFYPRRQMLPLFDSILDFYDRQVMFEDTLENEFMIEKESMVSTKIETNSISIMS